MQYNSLADAIIAISYRLYEVLSGIKFLVASLGGRGGGGGEGGREGGGSGNEET